MFLKKWFFNTVEAKVIILTWYIKPNDTIDINKFQRSGLVVHFSANVAYIWAPLLY